MASKSMKLQKMNHAAGIFADISVDGPTIGTLVAVIDRAKNLPNRKTMGKQNPYCAARLGKEARKTGTDWRGGQTPRWDQELRFTVHESADYFKLKVSVFNDDKRTDLIGETWVDLSDLVKPGGSQGDHWHPLQCRGKYAGEVRIEMTYYDTRPEDETVIERRKGIVERGPEKLSASTGSSMPPSMGSSIGSSSVSLSGPRQPKDIKRRPLPTDPANPPVRPRPEKMPTAPPAPPTQLPRQFDYGHYAGDPRMERQHDMLHDLAPKGYETPDDFHQWDMPQVAPPGMKQYADYPDERDHYDPRSRMYDMDPVMHRAYEPRQTQHVHEYRPSQMTPYQPGNIHDQGYALERPRSQHGPARLEMNREHPEYAAMQPRVEDEDEGPPPPPPVHRSGLAQGQSPSYKAYSPEQRSHEMNRPVSSHSAHSQRGRLPESQPGGSVPPSLVAGHDPVVAEAEADRNAFEMQARRNSMVEAVPYPEPLSYGPPYPVESSIDEQRKALGSRGSAHSDSRVQRKSVSPQPPEREARIPFSPDSYDALNPNAARSAVTRDSRPVYDTPAQAMDAARRSEAEAARDPGPIIGDDGKEIDPSDHLPTDTWAPEPEKKNRKPEVIIRFKNTKASPGRDRPPPNWRRQQHAAEPSVRTPPRGRESYGRSYGTPNTESPRSPYRQSGSVSPSSMYASAGPPIPAKVPIGAPSTPSHPMSSPPGMDALSRELKSIEIGSVACSPGRRKYVPPSVTGYAI